MRRRTAPDRGLTVITLTVILAPLAIAAVAVGCGTANEQSDYVDQVNAAQKDLLGAVNQVVSGSVPTNTREAAQVADELSAAFADAADQMEQIDPPEEVAKLHASLVAGLRKLSGRLADAAKALTGSNAQDAADAAADLQQQISHAQTRINGLIDQINSVFQS
jgi:methyl-accepting chemotaxis protein